MATPYVTPAILVNAPTGISWSTIPTFGADPDAQLAEQTNMCWRATHWIDSYCNQPLRSTIDTEEFLGPNYRMTVDNNGLVRVLVSRWPVTSIISAQYAPATAAGPTWSPIPLDAMYIEEPVDTTGGISIESAAGSAAIDIVPGYISWWSGRRGMRLQLTYVNGWSHAGIIGATELGATELEVDDCTGMLIAADSSRGMWIYDGNLTEYVTVTAASAISGPGTITLAAGTTFAHNGSVSQPIVISALPASVQQAAILHCSMQAIVRGATATTVQNQPGSTTNSGAAGASMLADVKLALKPYRRVI